MMTGTGPKKVQTGAMIGLREKIKSTILMRIEDIHRAGFGR